MVAIDGTRLAGNASRESNRDFAQIAREILAEAKATDEAEDELYGDERGDELPEQLRTREGRAEFFRQARERRAAETPEDQQLEPEPEPARLRRMPSSSTPSGSWRATKDARVGRGKRTASSSVAAGRPRILFPARVRIGCCSRASGWRPSSTRRSRRTGRMRITAQNGRDTQGRRLGRRPKPWVAPDVPEGMVSVSDPDSQRMKANDGYVQGYNAQAVVDEGQIVLAAEITNTPADFSNLDPMITAAIGELERAGVAVRPQIALADAQYWNEQHMDEVIANKHIEVLIPPDSGGRRSPGRAGSAGATHGCEPCWQPTARSSTENACR